MHRDFGPPTDQESCVSPCVSSGGSSSSLSSFEDVDSPQAPLEAQQEMEEGSLDDSFAKETPAYDMPVKQRKMSREASRKQAVRRL